MNRKVVLLASLFVIGLTAGSPRRAEAATFCANEGQVCNPNIPFPCCNSMTLCTEKYDPWIGIYHICEAVD